MNPERMRYTIWGSRNGRLHREYPSLINGLVHPWSCLSECVIKHGLSRIIYKDIIKHFDCVTPNDRKGGPRPMTTKVNDKTILRQSHLKGTSVAPISPLGNSGTPPQTDIPRYQSVDRLQSLWCSGMPPSRWTRTHACVDLVESGS